MNKTIELLKNHRSIRKFNQEIITTEEENAIIESAMRGATAGNMMLYSIVTIRDKKKLKALASSCDHQPFIESADLALLFVVDTYKWQKFFESRGVLDHGEPYGGPGLPDMILGMQDAMIAAQNSVIAAESLGIGTCYIGDIIEHKEYHSGLFNLPENTMPATLIVMGKYDIEPEIRTRFDKEHVVFEESYPEINEGFVDNMFGKIEKKKENFAQTFYSRKIEADFFKEMIRSCELYLKQWIRG